MATSAQVIIQQGRFGFQEETARMSPTPLPFFLEAALNNWLVRCVWPEGLHGVQAQAHSLALRSAHYSEGRTGAQKQEIYIVPLAS